MRPLVLHYHIFKNAGSSVDAMLRANFGVEWAWQEFPRDPDVNHNAAIRQLILDRPGLRAISSHSLRLPVPEVTGVKVLPVMFVRHPLDRLWSAYRYQRRSNGPTPAAKLARATDFGGYVRAQLQEPGNRNVRNFQTWRLAMEVPDDRLTELERARAAVARLPFVGCVEAFAPSIARMAAMLRPWFPSFQSDDLHENADDSRAGSLEGRLAAMRAALRGRDLAALEAANQDDMALHQAVAALYPPR
jgi:hypothetical protein